VTDPATAADEAAAILTGPATGANESENETHASASIAIEEANGNGSANPTAIGIATARGTETGTGIDIARTEVVGAIGEILDGTTENGNASASIGIESGLRDASRRGIANQNESARRAKGGQKRATLVPPRSHTRIPPRPPRHPRLQKLLHLRPLLRHRLLHQRQYRTKTRVGIATAIESAIGRGSGRRTRSANENENARRKRNASASVNGK